MASIIIIGCTTCYRQRHPISKHHIDKMLKQAVVVALLAFAATFILKNRRESQIEAFEYGRKTSSTYSSKKGTILITGANVGLGLETARQLAGYNYPVDKIIVACRSEKKAKGAIAELVELTGKPASLFEPLELDVSDNASCRAAANKLSTPVDVVLLNAGGFGENPKGKHSSGVTNIFALNVLGHAVFVESLISSGKLAEGGKVVFSGSEFALGMKNFQVERHAYSANTADVIESWMTGSVGAFPYEPWHTENYYGRCKSIGAGWIGAMARQHPQYTFVTVSPGACSGTAVMGHLPMPQQILYGMVLPIMENVLGESHSKQEGAARYIDAMLGPQPSGSFYASAAEKVMGPVQDASGVHPIYADLSFQDACYGAVQRYVNK